MGALGAALGAGFVGVSDLSGSRVGSWWAYYELGWGGYWFWDPVENASLMPWLTGTALVHSAIVVEKRESLKIWTVLLAIGTFSLVAVWHVHGAIGAAEFGACVRAGSRRAAFSFWPCWGW